MVPAQVIGLSYATAFAETLTIAAFPYYTFTDRAQARLHLLPCSPFRLRSSASRAGLSEDVFCSPFQMYRVGSLFYAIYFFVSFPLFLRMDESARRASTNARGRACALIPRRTGRSLPP